MTAIVDMNERLCAKAMGSGIEEPRKLNISLSFPGGK